MKLCPAILRSCEFALLLVVSFLLPPAGRAQTPDTFLVPLDGPIYAMAIQPDGRVVLGGRLTTLNGVTRTNLARINRDGTLDNTFNPSPDSAVYGIAVQPDGKLVVAGAFTTLAGTSRNRLARLNPDGSVDPAFNPGADGEIRALALQADGKIVVGGTFTNLAGGVRSRIGRLNPDGTPDTGFYASADAPVCTLALQPDGKIVVGGEFQTLNGVTVAFISRLNTNGSLDMSFAAMANNFVHALAVEADGGILAGGLFNYMTGQSHVGLARLLPNGQPDAAFTAAIRPGYLGDSDNLAIQSDGRFLVGGTAVGWFAYPYFGRFYADGTRDTNFTASIPSGVHASVLQRDGEILQATFSTFARMTNAPEVESLILTNSTLAWLRNGGGPEVWRTTFERSKDGSSWTVLGDGTRIPGGWNFSGIKTQGGDYFRARGYVANGCFNSSAWFVQAFLGPVVIVDQPSSRTNNAGTTATFSVVADGTAGLAYRWQKNGVALSDGANILGAASPTLTLSNVLHADAGSYSVVITNSYGPVASAGATLTVVDPFITSHPTNVYIDVGQTAQFNVAAAGTAPLGYQWRKNGTNFPGATAATLTLSNVPITDGGSTWQVVVSNAYGTMTSAVARLTVNGALADSLNPSPNYFVNSLAVQPDGKTLLGGYFSWVGDQLQVGIARLKADGTLETNFIAGIVGSPDTSARPTVALQEDGKILLAGGITAANGVRRMEIARYNPDGSLDGTFNPGALGDVNAMALQTDGKILLGGSFTNLGGQVCNHLGRLNPDGTLDTNFVSAVNGTVNDLAVQADGKILVGGTFTALGVTGIARTNLGRLNVDGSVDGTFNPGANGPVNALAVQADGAILVGGLFTSLGGQLRNNLGRLSSTGTVDLGFNPRADGNVLSLVVQTDAKICVGGAFTTLGGQPRSNLGRLNPDGSADMTFNPGANGLVYALALQPDGSLLAGGEFTVLNGQNRQYLGRLVSPGSAVQNLTFNASSITWQRTGAGPEVLNAFFDIATNGSNLARVPGTRTTGGWQATGLTLPPNATVRARGWIAGSSIGSSWYAQSVLGPSLIERQPVSCTNDAFTVATFNILATGEPPLSYRWFQNGSPLSDGANITGASTPLLTLNSVLGPNAGAYQCVVSNVYGSVTSQVATLTVRDPLFTVQPVGANLNAGQNAQFSATATGTAPIGYYWLKDGVPLTDDGNVFGSQTATLTVTNVTGIDGGAYRVVASNVWGSSTSAVAALTVVDPLLVTNPVSRLVQRGSTATLSVLVVGAAPLLYQWRKEGVELTGATNAVLPLFNVQAADAGHYDVVVTNVFGRVTSTVATLTVNVAIADSLNSGANAEVDGVALQTDGKVLVVGNFTTLGGQTRNRLARLNPDGTLDASFNPGANGRVWCVAVQPDQRILVGGDFTVVAGLSRTNLARLNPNGTVDSTFAPNPDSIVFALLPHPDGATVVGGLFSRLGGLPCARLGRLDSTGALDTNFNASVDLFVSLLGYQSDGQILVGGLFSSLNGVTRGSMGRLLPDGMLDNSFTNGANASARVFALAEQPDGKILVGGWFGGLAGQPRNYLGRLNRDGSLDGTFNPTLDGTVYSLALRADGRMVIGGEFTSINGQPCARLATLNADGAVDLGFNPNPDGTVYTVACQPDGSLLVGGTFTTIAGQARARLARLNDPILAIGSWFFDGSSITWLRNGSGPELARTFFETTTDGTNWTFLGNGTRGSGGWTLGGVSLPPKATVRARGFVTACGFQSSSSWLVESVAGMPLLVSHPVSQTNNATTTASFSVTGVTGLSVAYSWLKNGVPLADSGNVSGAQTSTLVLSNVLGADAGAYQAVLKSLWGSVTSAVATLTVIDPLLTSQPAALAVNAGQTATFSISAVGTAPLAYQWWFGGAPLSGGTSSVLTLTNVGGANAGSYTVVVSNGFGAVTSAPAALAVNLGVPDGFNPGSSSGAGPFVLQPDGKLVIAGLFGSPNSPRYLVRFNPDGSRDPGFLYSNVVVDVSSTYTLALQPDNRILGSGLGRQLLPTALWRLNENGTVDPTFSNQLSGAVYGLVLRPDGNAWTAGSFSYSKPSLLTNLALVHPSGQVETNLLIGVGGIVYALAAQPDGKLLLGGAFTAINGQTATRLARLNPEGMLDTSFSASANGTVHCLVVQPDGKMLVAGMFTTLNGTNINRLGRLNADGSVDTTFNPSVNNTVYSLALQADGRVVVGGLFTGVAGQTRNRLARINPDGTLDPSFNPNASGSVYSVGLQADGAVVVAGSFAQMTGQYRTNIARLVPSEPAIQTLSFNGATLVWLRGGTAPEVWRTTFESSSDGANWTSLGAGERTSGGWRLANVTLSPGAYVRARGFTTGGEYNACSWFVESGLGPALLTSQPASRTNLAGTTASFWVSASGSPPLSYRWFKAGQPLSNGANVWGADTASLVLSNVLGGDAGSYSVVVSNASGSVTSRVAYLTVIEPIITVQPVAAYTNVGQPASFSVSAFGTQPLSYQWRKNGVPIPGASASVLAFPGTQSGDAAPYSVVVSSPYGSVTSSIVTLTLNLALPEVFPPVYLSEVRCVATRPDGKILIGGNLAFTRLNPDGSSDTNFNGNVNSSTDTVAVQPDGNMLVGGWFNYANNWPHSSICRFYPDGSLDPAINPSVTYNGLGVSIESLVPQPDGKFLVGGWFTFLGGQIRPYVGRCNADGSVDAFSNTGANDYVQALALQPDGKIVVAGRFTSLGGQTRNRIGRLYSDGTLDTAFNPNASDVVNALVLQPDGKLLVGGSFISIAGYTRSYLARLNADGTMDNSFNCSVNGAVAGMALQADGSVIIAGGFSTVGGQARSGLARVNALGGVDSTWSPQMVGGVSGVSIQPDGKVLVGGSLSSVCGQACSRIIRLGAVGSAEHRVDCDAQGVTWWRSGTSPEVTGAWFELSTDGTNWTRLGTAVRVPGGWHLNTTALTLNAQVRARGFHSGGRWNGSLSLIEDATQVTAQTPPVIVSNDSAFGFQTNQFGFTVCGLPGQGIVVEATADFVTWVPLQTNYLTSPAQFVFRDGQSGLYSNRFYRARPCSGALAAPAIQVGRGLPVLQ